MNKCDIRVVTAHGRDNTALSETFRRLGYDIVGAPHVGDEIHDEIVVVDARGTCPTDWATIERDLTGCPGPTVIISDEHDAAFVARAQRLGRSVVFASGGSDMGYGVAVKLCALMLAEQHAEVAA